MQWRAIRVQLEIARVNNDQLNPLYDADRYSWTPLYATKYITNVIRSLFFFLSRRFFIREASKQLVQISEQVA
jgi:hypothetical protein